MKKIKFAEKLVPLIFSGEKTSTWRLFDDKDLSKGDELEFLNSENGEIFAKARIIEVRTKKLGEVIDHDYEAGHERYESQEEMIKSFQGYYGDRVSIETEVKMIKFELK